MSAPHPEVPRKFRLAITDRAAARSAVRRILAWDARAASSPTVRPSWRMRPGSCAMRSAGFASDGTGPPGPLDEGRCRTIPAMNYLLAILLSPGFDAQSV